MLLGWLVNPYAAKNLAEGLSFGLVLKRRLLRYY
jgi:hypothetical protein